MKKFKVEIEEVCKYSFEVEAETEDDAIAYAEEHYNEHQPDEMYMNDYAIKEVIDKNNLSKKQLWELRLQICLGSIYINDYVNTYNIPAEACCCFFESFLEDCWDLAKEEGYNTTGWDITDLCKLYDKADCLYNYYCSCEYPFGDD